MIDLPHRRYEYLHILICWFVGSIKTGFELMIKLIEMAKVQFTILAPLANTQAPRLTLDQFGVVEKTIE